MIGLIYVFAVSVVSVSSGSEKQTPRVTYRAEKEMNFEELLIQGRLQRPEISVITGDQAEGTDGLLRLRENFLDRMAADIGEEIK